jgi:DNA-directed RNA polymerase specialized sigma24 family protein
VKLDGDAFRLLLERLSHDAGEAGLVYESLRQRLIRYFSWERTPRPEELADEVLDRVARKLHEGEPIRDLPSYSIGVARLVAAEERTRSARRNALLVEAARTLAPVSLPDGGGALPEETEPCFPRCLAELAPESRQLLLRYYSGDGGQRIRNRKELAAELGVELNALRNRALRLRERLEQCMDRCRKRGKLSRMMDRHGGDSKGKDPRETSATSGPEAEDRKRMISYLLDQLPEEEREPLRERLAMDPLFFDALQELEYDLCDSYVRGTLEPAVAASLAELERMSPFWRDRIAAARQLQSRVQATRKRPNYQRLAPAAAASVAAALLAYQGWQWSNRPQALPAPAPAAIVATLVPGTLRDAAGIQTIRVPQGTELVRLDLDAEGLTASGPVRATLRAESGPVLLLVPAIPVEQAGRLRLTVPATLLTPGRFALELRRGEEPAYEYRFEVLAR